MYAASTGILLIMPDSIVYVLEASARAIFDMLRAVQREPTVMSNIKVHSPECGTSLCLLPLAFAFPPHPNLFLLHGLVGLRGDRERAPPSLPPSTSSHLVFSLTALLSVPDKAPPGLDRTGNVDDSIGAEGNAQAPRL